MRAGAVVVLAFATSLATTLGTLWGAFRYNPLQLPQKVTVPELVGLSEQDARNNLEAVGLKTLVAGREASSKVEPGRASRQEPAAGAKLEHGAAVKITFASMPPEVPSVVGKPLEDAKNILRKAGFEVTVGEPMPSADHAQGSVAAQNPKAGERLPKQGKVELRVSAGPAEVEVPKLVGMHWQRAKAEAEKAGHEVTVQWTDLPETTSFFVLRQTPEPGVKAEPGSALKIVVNR